MTGFPALPLAARAVILSLLLVVFLIQFFCLAMMRRPTLLQGMLALLLAAADLLFLLPLLGGSAPGATEMRPPRAPVFHEIYSMPWVLLIVLLALLTALSVWNVVSLRSRMRHAITPAAIQETLNNMPMGLCFCLPSGQLLLVNRKMESLCQSITGEGLLSARRFWSLLSERGSGALTDEREWIRSARLPDGSVWTFTREQLTVRGTTVIQMVATDTTQLHQAGLELQERNRQLIEMNRRLRSHSENVTALTRAEEILAAKVRIHDELGQTLLISRAYLTGAAAAEPAQLLDMWRQNVALFYQKARPQTTLDPVRQIEDAARAVGIRIVMEGTLPRDEPSVLRLFFAAARECLTNAVRHANASEITIRFQTRPLDYLAVFTNNGVLPETDAIVEGGGLSGLRRQVEKAGGSMAVSARPVFALKVSIPKERGAEP
ncbi:MAG: hypothetical protein IKD96_05440 [Oscillospiraceae bacterium]|nr:hypothetical protein [Oscillospiraceae bacterium]